MALDSYGIIAAVEIALYVPILIVGGVLSLRHGFARKAGWIFLVILAIIRIIGGVARILSEQNPANKTDRVIYGIMESSGLSPLLMATLGFLGTVCQHSLDSNRFLMRALRLLGLLGVAGLILGIVGGTNAANASSQSGLDSANTLRRVGVLLFVVLFAGAMAAAVFCWLNRALILRYRRQLLIGILATLPFLAVRVLYATLSAFAPSSIAFVDGDQVLVRPSADGLGRFSSASSQWGIYLGMSVLMEYAAVIIYAVTGVVTPLQKDIPGYAKTEADSPRGSSSNAHPMNAYARPS